MNVHHHLIRLGSVAAALLIGLAVSGGASWMWSKYHANRDDLTPIVTLGGAAVAAWVALRQVRIALRQANTAAERHEAQTRADQQRRITESFSKAVEQLGSDKLEVRLGGIYSLERISKESPDDYWTVMENLTAFVRERSRRNEGGLKQRISRRAYFLWLEAGRPDGRAEEFWAEAIKREEIGEPPAADIAAVLTVIKRRSEQSQERESANAWRFDLSGTMLKQASFSGSLKKAILSGAHLEGAFLSGAHLEGAILVGAHLERAFLVGAHLERAILQSAHLERAILVNAHLERTSLRSAHLEGAFLSGAHLEGAILVGAHLEAAILDYAKGLSETQLAKAYGNASTLLPEGMARPAHWLDPDPDQRPPAPEV